MAKGLKPIERDSSIIKNTLNPQFKPYFVIDK